MKHLILQHYTAIKNRGLITPITTFDQFMEKLHEEYMEVNNAYADCVANNQCPSDELIYELTDLVMVVANCFQHYNIDLAKQIAKNCKVQEDRVI